ncbi:gamma-glutamylcyclotransferase family protein [Curtobacterium sp. B18]|uniref:gamma-glutamylcyclotransferase family protein n=1 Tax=Curtobacterium sp. B18 TaxID=95614 RepID=UPI001C9D914C|nr:gamma-glutamylcyclotransferase family protein [Curtobacterium sp. B18]
MHRLSPAQRWVVALGTFAVVLLVVGVVGLVVGLSNRYGCLGAGESWPEERCLGDDSGIVWGSVLGIAGLLHLGLTGLAGAIVWTAAPTIAPGRLRRPAPNVGVNVVFTVGTLRQPEVQDALFGDPVPTAEDALAGWRVDDATSTDPDVIRAGGPGRRPSLRRGTSEDRVEGAALTLGYEWQLRDVDDHEPVDHQRIEVTLESGTRAWVYVAADEV